VEKQAHMQAEMQSPRLKASSSMVLAGTKILARDSSKESQKREDAIVIS